MYSKFSLARASVPRARWLILVLLICGAWARATDWPQFMGPNWNLTTPEEAPGPWPTNGPRVVWRVPLAAMPYEAGCFASLAVADGRVLLVTTNGCEALDARSGRLLWVACTNMGLCHSTPTVNSGRVFVYGGNGVLSCLDAADGHLLWAQTLSNYVTGYRLFYNHSQSPLVANGRVIVLAGGQTNCALAFDATTGALLWRGHNFSVTHASPVLATFSGVPQLVCQGGSPSRLIGLAPDDGRLLWTHTNSALYTTPIPWGESLLCPEQCRGVLNVVLSNGFWGVTQAWTTTQFATTWTLPVAKDGFIYEICSANMGELRCVRSSDGAVQWSTNGFGRGSLILAGSRLVALAESGWLHLVEPSPESFRLLSRCQPLTNLCFNLPVVADGRIYLRNDKTCVCLDTQPPAPVLGELSCRNRTNYILTIRTTDNSMIDAARAGRIGVRTATTLTTNSSTWVPLTTPRSYTNGTLVYTNLPPPSRFFSVCETNAP